MKNKGYDAMNKYIYTYKYSFIKLNKINYILIN